VHISYNTLCYHTITKQTWHPADAIAVELGVCRAAIELPRTEGIADRDVGVCKNKKGRPGERWGQFATLELITI
jgi:hypothetical protein